MNFESVVEKQKAIIKEAVKEKVEGILNESRSRFGVFVKEKGIWTMHIMLDDKEETEVEVESIPRSYGVTANGIKVVMISRDDEKQVTKLMNARDFKAVSQWVDGQKAVRIRGASR